MNSTPLDGPTSTFGADTWSVWRVEEKHSSEDPAAAPGLPSGHATSKDANCYAQAGLSSGTSND
jgi:hypothetical protein